MVNLDFQRAIENTRTNFNVADIRYYMEILVENKGKIRQKSTESGAFTQN